MRNTALLLFMLMNTVLWAQNSTDSTYIQTYPEDLQIIPSMRYVRSQISIKANQNTSLEYLQSATVFSTRVQFDKWGLALSVPTKLLSGKSNSSSFGAQLQIFPKSLMINAGATRMKGFQKVNVESKNVEAFYSGVQDMRLLHLYVNPIYIFSKEKYAFRSALQLTERQLKSHGSFLAALRLEYLRLKSDLEVIEQDELNSSLTDYTFRQNGLEAGYAYTQIVAKNYFLSAIWLGGFAHTRTGYQQDQSKYHFKKWQFIPVSDLTLSAGYQSNRYVSAIQINYRNRPMKSEDIQMEANGFSIQLLCGIRLHAPGLRREIDQRAKNFAQQFVPVRGY